MAFATRPVTATQYTGFGVPSTAAVSPAPSVICTEPPVISTVPPPAIAAAPCDASAMFPVPFIFNVDEAGRSIADMAPDAELLTIELEFVSVTVIVELSATVIGLTPL